MKRIIYYVILTALLISLMSGCSTPAANNAPDVNEAPAAEANTQEAAAATEAPTPEPVTIKVTDALDRTVEFDQYPTRIVIAGKAGFFIANAAFQFTEATERIVGFVPSGQTENDFIKTIYPQAATMATFETSASVEQIAPLNPDLVMMKSYLKDDLGAQFEQIGVKVLYFDLESPEALAKDIRTLGQVFGDSARAEQLISLYEQDVKAVTDITSTLSDDQKPSVLVLQHSDKGGEVAFKIPPAEWIQTRMVELAGGYPVWTETPTDGWTVITLEQIAAWNPDIILMVNYGGKALDVVNELKADPKWTLLDSVKNGQIYAFPLDFQSWDQADTRWTLGLTWVATKLHPDLFSSISIYERIQYFYASRYTLSDNTIEQTIMPLMKGDL